MKEPNCKQVSLTSNDWRRLRGLLIKRWNYENRWIPNGYREAEPWLGRVISGINNLDL